MKSNIRQLIRGNPVYIVGGGQSVQNVDLRELRNKITIGINDAFRYIPMCNIVYFMDRSWARRTQDVPESVLRVTSKHLHAEVRKPEFSDVILVHSPYIVNVEDSVFGNNSGVQALTMALNFGASEVNLLGFDFTGPRFHSDNTVVTEQSGYDSMKENYDRVIEYYHDRKVKRLQHIE